MTPQQRGVAFTILVIGLIGTVSVGAFLLNEGASASAPVNAAALSADNVVPLALDDPASPGAYAVRTLTYGSGVDRRPAYGAEADLRTASVDGSQLLEGWSALRSAYWGFGPDALPLNAQVWMPEPGADAAQAGGATFPLILIVHGNHPMEDASEHGYAYLAELLASRGFIVASLEQNFLNLSLAANLALVAPLKDENDARAWLILEHLQQWRVWNATPGNPFYGRVDLDNIGLIGHSRGGEAIAIAAAFNHLPRHPENASVNFDYHFNIRAVAALAPVDGQFLPGERPLPLQDVNYLVMHGAHDMDVASFSGLRQFQRLQFERGEPWFKAALYLYGANHGQFNRSWGRRDVLGPARQLFNLGALMPAPTQEQLVKVFVSAFMEASLRGQSAYRAIFRDPRAGAAWLPDTIILSRYQEAGETLVATFEEDIDLESATLASATIRGEGLTQWREQVVPLKWGVSSMSAAYLAWEATAGTAPPRYILTLPATLAVSPQTELVFALAASEDADLPDAPVAPDALSPLDLTVEVVDGNGESARLPLSHFSLLQPPLHVELGKLSWMGVLPRAEAMLQTFAFPLNDFTMHNPRFDPSALIEIRFVFDRSPTGAVILDDVGFR